MIYIILAGAAGGLVRGLVGFIKHQFAYKNVKFDPVYFLTMMLISAFIGFVVTWAVAGSGLRLPVVEELNPPLAFIVGYAGGDFLENLYKIIVGKTTLYPIPKN